MLEKGSHASPEGVKERLQATADDDVVGICRLLLVDGRPLTIEELYFLRSRYEKAIDPVTKGGSFNEALNTFYGEQPTAAERTINVDFPSPTNASSRLPSVAARLSHREAGDRTQEKSDLAFHSRNAVKSRHVFHLRVTIDTR